MIMNNSDNGMLRIKRADFLVEIGLYEEAVPCYYEAIDIYADSFDEAKMKVVYQKLSNLQATRAGGMFGNDLLKKFQNLAAQDVPILP